MKSIYENVEKVILSAENLKLTVERLAQEIKKDYIDKNPLIVCVLSGSFVFAADLVRAIDIPLQMAFLSASSYSGTAASGNVEIKPIKGFHPEGRDIIIVEDILDTGITLKNICEYILNSGANSVEICVLLDKPSRRKIDISAKYTGLEIPDEFVVGYGLDYNEKYRNLPFIGVFKQLD